MKTILVVDDELKIVQLARDYLEHAGFSVLTAHDGDSALATVRAAKPNLVILDLGLPKMDGLEATRRMKSLYPTASVVMISVYDNDAYIIDAIRAGAAGYILKDVSKDLLVHTIKAVNAGGVLLKSSLLHRALKGIGPSESEVHREGSAPPPDGISARELDVLRLVVEGLTNKQIANRLSLAEDTVKKHVQSLIAKLQASDRTQAAVKAVRAGIIPEISRP